MRLSDGASSLVSALLGAGLAVGAVYGGHILLGEPETDLDRPGSHSDWDTAGGLCALMTDMLAYAEEYNNAQVDSTLVLNGTTADEGEMLDALHDIGRAMIEGSENVAEYFKQAAPYVDDAEVAQEFVVLADAQEEAGRIQGDMMVDVRSLDEFWTASMEMVADQEFLDLVDEGNAALLIVQPYVIDACGIDVVTGESVVDANLVVDASALGKEIATYFVDWDGVTLPEVTVSEGSYYLGDTLIGEQGAGVVLSDQWAFDSTDWCVEVASAGDADLVYSYSAQQGLDRDTCASLHP